MRSVGIAACLGNGTIAQVDDQGTDEIDEEKIAGYGSVIVIAFTVLVGVIEIFHRCHQAVDVIQANGANNLAQQVL